MLPKVKRARKIIEIYNPVSIKKLLIENFYLKEEDSINITNYLISQLTPKTFSRSNVFLKLLNSRKDFLPRMRYSDIKEISNELTKTIIIEDFDESKILISLTKETNLTQKKRVKIVETLTRRIIFSNVELITAPNLREMICSITTEIGEDKERVKYSAPRIPYFDLKEMRKDLNNFSENTPFCDIEKLIIKENIRNSICKQISTEYKEMTKIIKKKKKILLKEEK